MAVEPKELMDDWINTLDSEKTTLLYNFGSSILRAVGDTKRPLFYLVTAGIINVCFNLFFVIVCHLGVAGVGLATVIAEYISAALIIRCLMANNNKKQIKANINNPCRHQIEQRPFRISHCTKDRTAKIIQQCRRHGQKVNLQIQTGLIQNIIR